MFFWRSKPVGQQIIRVASAIDDHAEFKARARLAAETLGPKAIKKTKPFLKSPPKKPAELRGKFEGIDEWASVCQIAVFEILYNFGERALPLLRSIAFGFYDWTQAHATSVLCRLAVDGVERNDTANRISDALRVWRYEQIMRVCDPVAALAAHSPVVRETLQRLIQTWKAGDPMDVFELIAALSRHDPESARLHAPYVRALMRGGGLDGRTTLDRGRVVSVDGGMFAAKSGPSYPLVDDYHQIRAAMLLLELLPDDQIARDRLESWEQRHPDASIRVEIRRRLARARDKCSA